MLEVMRRRGELLARISSQREQLSEIGTCWKRPLALADQGLAVVNFLSSRPVLVAGVAALFIIRRRGVMGLARNGLLMWKGYRYFAALSAKLSSRS
ncbi:MAG: hypothetical protein A3F73_04220 [Gallionellales bacterium RIFCSPLOWO2_12_FULL_59_22]|nr:MAG: hypothetical protein A3H99_09980 [Gallionellales bacterium RIFCSPLOWO2_02_FULL_59_110]OGT04210.1 MAG: hypothetical protein A2Z65_12050 [Gallionellales bacterium RIFCSPLOWO2_02_58_13]OGT11373.1 MAG: hypothetical protein A3F73_04220 [Gallionellales bacterium RIFCSPLOWO2_12_FULL_59_22]